MKPGKSKIRSGGRGVRCASKNLGDISQCERGGKNGASPSSVPYAGKIAVRRDVSGVLICLDGAGVIVRISIHELQSAESTASSLLRLSTSYWMTLDLFTEILGHVCATLNVR
jgi:hypothetical protein